MRRVQIAGYLRVTISVDPLTSCHFLKPIRIRLYESHVFLPKVQGIAQGMAVKHRFRNDWLAGVFPSKFIRRVEHSEHLRGAYRKIVHTTARARPSRGPDYTRQTFASVLLPHRRILTDASGQKSKERRHQPAFKNIGVDIRGEPRYQQVANPSRRQPLGHRQESRHERVAECRVAVWR